MSQTFEFRLTILGVQKSWTYIIPIRPEPIIIGRQPGVDLLLEHQQVSRHHAELRCTTTECVLIDLSSANGTRLNGQKLSPQVPIVLKVGDSIQIGAFNLDFEQIPIETPSPSEKAEVYETPPPQEEPVIKTQQPGVPPPPPPPSPTAALPTPRFDPSQPPPGLTFRSDRLLNYLPGIYHTGFMENFLAIFESVLFPVEWQIDNFDLFLAPGTAPAGFLPWLGNWFGAIFDTTWSEAQRRTFLKEAYWIYSRCGTRMALSRVLEIYTGHTPEIDDQAKDLPPHTFRVKLPRVKSLDRNHINRLINAHKPAHTACILEMEE